MNNINSPEVQAQLEAWRKSLLHDLSLPSGLNVRVKQVSLMDLMIQGAIPDSLSGFVQEAMNSEKDEEGNPKIDITAENLPQMAQMFNVVFRACVVSPPLADEPDDNHLGIQEVPFDDKQAVFEWANGEASALVPFREQSGEPDSTATAALPVQELQLSTE